LKLLNGENYLLLKRDLNKQEEFTEEEIVNIAWAFGLLIQNFKNDSDKKEQFFKKIIDTFERSSPKIQTTTIDFFLNFIDEFNERNQIKLINILISLNNYSYEEEVKCKQLIEICDVLSRISRRVDRKVYKLIQDFIYSNIPNIKENQKYKEIITRVSCSNIQKNNHLIKNSSNTKNTEVLLIVPEFLTANSFLQPPVDMLMAAAQLKKAGYGVNLIDNRVEHLSLEHLSEKSRNADAIIITTTPYDHIQNYFLDYRLKYCFMTINEIKKNNPSSTIIVCGAHGTVRPDLVFNDCLADIIVKWEYDYQLVEIINALANNNDLSIIPNICIRNNRENLTDKKDGREFAKQDLNDGVLPAYNLIDFKNYYGDVYVNNKLIRQPRCGVILASRGCKHNCTFCFNFWGQKMRYRDPFSVLEEIKYLQKIHQVNEIFFLDFHFTQNEEWVRSLCELLIKNNNTVQWSAQARCDYVSLDLLKLMAEAKCKSLWFGVESYDSSIVKDVHKYANSNVALQAIEACLKVGIAPHQFLVIGLPGETKETINKTISRVHELKIPYTESIMVATPRFGTEYYKLAKKQFPSLGEDFYSLASTKGIISNSVTPKDLLQANSIFKDRSFIYKSSTPKLPCL
jgi:anaerobic magnesium-protoporphyrin IX monomethyl ester cyclase